jgi:hypothetical protein
MQIGIWMSYSDSMQFSEQVSYKILSISNHGLKDMNLARITYLQEFCEKRKQKNWDGSDLRR